MQNSTKLIDSISIIPFIKNATVIKKEEKVLNQANIPRNLSFWYPFLFMAMTKGGPPTDIAQHLDRKKHHHNTC